MAGSLRTKSPVTNRAEKSVITAPVALGMMGVAMRDEERVRLARDIHDDLGAELTALRISLSRVAISDGFTAMSPAGRALADAESALEAAFSAMRRLIDDRHALPPATDLVARLREWVDSFSQRSGLHITFDYKFDPRLAAMDEATATAIWRICQEALHNVVKHAQASNATVSLAVLASGVRLVVTDDGRGIAAARAAHAERAAQDAMDDGDDDMPASGSAHALQHHHRDGVGLESMRQRCEALGGRFALTDVPATENGTVHIDRGTGVEVPILGGTVVDADLPWTGPQPKERRSVP
jgi:signal transduction histidine kinase